MSIYSIIRKIREMDTVVTKEMELMIYRIYRKINMLCILDIVQQRFIVKILSTMSPKAIQRTSRFNDDTTAYRHDVTYLPLLQRAKPTANSAPIIYVYSQTYNQRIDIDKFVNLICISQLLIDNGKHKLKSTVELRSNLGSNRPWTDDEEIKKGEPLEFFK